MWLRRIIATLLVCAGTFGLAPAAPAHTDGPLSVVVIGDSLSAGYGLAAKDAFPAQLEAALTKKGYAVRVENAGVSGDTTAGGRARLGWAIGGNPGAVILELGANDALRGLEPEKAYQNLAAMLDELAAKNIPVLLAGMKAPPNLGEDYGREFNGLYARLAKEFDVILYPFFLEGVAGQPALNQDDGLHPTAEGIGIVVDNILPAVEQLLSHAGAAAGRS